MSRYFSQTEGARLLPENLVKRKLKPLLKQLGLEGGLHALRHGNATAQDRLYTPMRVRQEPSRTRQHEDNDGIHAPGRRRRPQGSGATRRLVLSVGDEPNRREDHVDARFAAGIL